MKHAENRVLEIIELLGGILDIDDLRSKTLELIRTMVWFDRAVFWLFDPIKHRASAPPVLKDLPYSVIDCFEARGGFAIDLVYQAARARKMNLGRSTDVLDYRAWVRKPIFNELYLPYDGYYQLGCNICEGSGFYGAICLYRGKMTGNFKLRDVEAISLIYPHLLNRLRLQFWLENTCGSRPANSGLSLPGGASVLTLREADVARLVCTGASNREIALNLNISINTVKMYLQNIYGKLDIKRRGQLIVLGSGRGFFNHPPAYDD